jgi:hypothetical protein
VTDHDREQDRKRWTKLVADYEASDLTQREFASERGVSFSNLRNWIYRLRQESRPLVTKAPASSDQAQPALPERSVHVSSNHFSAWTQHQGRRPRLVVNGCGD